MELKPLEPLEDSNQINMLKNFEEMEGYKVLKAYVERIKPYIQAKDVNEVIFNREKEVWLMKGSSFERIVDLKMDSETLLFFCKHLATYRDFYFDEKFPILACSIPHTRIRINALHPSITPNHQIGICIRIPSNHPFKIEEFVLGEKCKYDYDEIKKMVIRGDNILISGGTASGKTSLLNAMIAHIPAQERVFSIEDSPELNLERLDNIMQILVGRYEKANITYEDAINSAMRMSPQRLMVGEIDTRNTTLFLRLGNTGHKGMISTLHANSVDTAIEAIILNIKINNTADIPVDTIKDFFKSAIDVIIQINKIGNQRVIEEIKYTKDL